MNFICAVIGTFCGTCFGILLTCCVVAGKYGDLINENGELKRSLEKPKAEVVCSIRFTDTRGNTLFHIADGEAIELTDCRGERIVTFCRYLDSEHAEINGVKWQMQKFAERMLSNGISFAPLRN